MGESDPAGATVRETYEEFELRDATVAMVSDPENRCAWIQSSVTVAVER